MNITVSGPRGGLVDKHLMAYTHLAIKNFAKQLGIGRLKLNLDVRLHHNMFVENNAEGLCEAHDDRTFTIDVGLYSNWIVNLAHEMVHVKQFARHELSICGNRWKSRNWPDTDYWEEPWEKEARRLQQKLAMNFSKEEWA